jgi:hypothetical protein
MWGVTPEGYMRIADPWPMNPDGEMLFGRCQVPECLHREQVIEQLKDGVMICTGGDTPAADKGRAFTQAHRSLVNLVTQK